MFRGTEVIGVFDWEMVSLGKLGAWYLLMIISFVLVTIVHRPKPVDGQD